MVSSKDVAKKAGVSQSTVSRVINNPSSVSKQKREKIEKVMKELNYRPDSIAQSLISNKTNQISLISGTLNNPFFVETTKSITNYAYEKGYNVNVYFEEDFLIDDVYETVFSQRNAGIILSSMYFESPYFKELTNLNIPYIMFNRKHKDGGNYVELDNFSAGQIACDYLIENGHKDIHWFGGEMYKSTFLERYQGYKYSLKKNKIKSYSSRVSITKQNPEEITNEVMRLIKSNNLPTAILASTDMIGLVLMNALQKQGIRIPEDLALIGIDNTDTLMHSSLNLTSVGVDSESNLGEIAIKHLIKMIENKQEGFIQETHKCKLYKRGTVK